MNAVATQQPYEVPEGGLASFLTATVGDWSDEALNSDNYYDIVKPTAEQLAAFGREEDDRIAHVATGETVIPMAVFEEDPALKEALFARMRDMGIEPERYIVGNQLNSINPVTGQPEFFLKKIFKGIKKAVKGVVKVFKKLAPIILSVGLNMMFPGLGTIASAALGSGIGTLIQGGSLKDALKAAAIGGAVGGLTSGIGSVMKGGEFMAGVKSGLPTGLGGGPNATIPAPKALTAEELASEAASKISEGTPVVDLTGAEALGPEIMPPQAGVGAVAKAPVTATQAVEQAAQTAPSSGNYLLGSDAAQQAAQTAPSSGNYLLGSDAAQQAAPGQTGGLDVTAPGTTAPAGTAITGVQDITTAVRQAADPGFFASMKEFFTTGNLDALKQAFLPGTKPEVILEKLKNAGFNVAPEVAGDIAEQLTPGIMRSYGPLAVAGLGVMGLTGGFEQPEMGELPDAFGGQTGMGLLTAYPGRYGLSAPGSQFQPVTYSANGGDISFPRKNGPIYGPGTETSDDIPAMLSDGEFVMTARAVRGAGNGSREAGMRRMYDIMRKFEGGAARGN
jgi:hypothetical protein